MPEFEITQEQLAEWLTRTVSQNRGLPRPTRTQRMLDATAEACLFDGEVALGIAVCTLHSMRVAGILHLGLQALLQVAFEQKVAGGFARVCRGCGCAEGDPCEPPRDWAEFDLCSECAARGRG